MTYYVQHNGIPLAGVSAAKVLNTVDSQTMALTLGYFIQLQAERKQQQPLSVWQVDVDNLKPHTGFRKKSFGKLCVL